MEKWTLKRDLRTHEGPTIAAGTDVHITGMREGLSDSSDSFRVILVGSERHLVRDADLAQALTPQTN